MSPDALLHDARNAAVMHGRWPDSVHDQDGADLGILRMSGGMICWAEVQRTRAVLGCTAYARGAGCLVCICASGELMRAPPSYRSRLAGVCAAHGSSGRLVAAGY